MTKVLVVDDNAIVRAGLQAVLGRVDTVDEVLEAEIIPAEPHDVPVDGIVTPTRTMAINLR